MIPLTEPALLLIYVNADLITSHFLRAGEASDTWSTSLRDEDDEASPKLIFNPYSPKVREPSRKRPAGRINVKLIRAREIGRMNAPTTFDMIDEEKSMGNPSASDASTSQAGGINFTIHPNCRVEEVMFSYAPYEILTQLHIAPAAPSSFEMADDPQPTTTGRFSPTIIDLVSDSDEEIHGNKLLPPDDDSDIEFLGVFPKPHGAVVSQTPIHRPFPRARKKHRQSAPSTTGRSRHPAAVSEVIVLSD